MRKVLFCNIAWMNRYQGISKDDKPQNGGKWINENNEAYEEFNFNPIVIDGKKEKYCLWFVETK